MELQSGLKKRMENEFSHFLLGGPESEQKTIQIFEQHLPEKPSNDISLYPYLIIRLGEGEIEQSQNPQMVKVLFIAGVYDENSNNQGYKDAVSIIQRIYENITRNPVINRRFELSYPMKWAYADEDAAPFFFCGLETSWSIPIAIQDDKEEWI